MLIGAVEGRTSGDGQGAAIKLANVLSGSQGGPGLEVGGEGEAPWQVGCGGHSLTSPLLEVLRIHQDHTIWGKDRE